MRTKLHSYVDFLALFPDKPRKKSGSGFLVICPAHNDHTPSLSVRPPKNPDFIADIKCQAGCTKEAVLTAMKLTWTDLHSNGHSQKDPPIKHEIEAIYNYTDANGKPFEVVRTKPKGFYQRQPDGKGGYINNLKGITPTLYHQEELKTAIDSNETIYVVEGEKDCDNLWGIGLVSTTNPMGAGKWRDSYSETLRGGDLVIIPDNDKPGREHAHQIAKSCYGKTTRIRILELPDTVKDVSDWLQEGHTPDELDNLTSQAKDYNPGADAEVVDTQKRANQTYCIEDGKFCYKKALNSGGLELIPLCNFMAKITADIQKDNGLETSRIFKLNGVCDTGENLHDVEVSATSFSSMNWVMNEWGAGIIITAGQMIKDRLREAIQIYSHDVTKKKVYTHTGWREIDGKRVFLIGSGGIGGQNIETEMDPQLQRYNLPVPQNAPTEAFKASEQFLYIGELVVTLPLWSAMYLAPLAEIIDPSFTLWYSGPSGAYKSTVTALALCHFGDFDENHLPASWRDTENLLEKLLFLAKDLPMIIDDWSPGTDPARARELEGKAEHIVRAQSNRQGKGRMRADTSSRPNYVPRGLLVTSGEQLPSGFSNTARIYVIPIEQEDIDTKNLTNAGVQRHLYKQAMANYISWVGDNYERLNRELPPKWTEWRDKAQSRFIHPRLPGCVASLYAGLYTAVTFGMEIGAMTAAEGEACLKDGWKIFNQLATEQGRRVEKERPAEKFLRGLRAVLDGGTAVLKDKNDSSAFEAPPNKTLVGWEDNIEELILLIPELAYKAVYQHYATSGDPFTIKKDAVGQDLKRMKYTDVKDQPRPTVVAWISGKSKRVWPLKRELLDEVKE